MLIISFLTVKCLQVMLFNSDNSFQNYPFICTLSNDSNYCYGIPIIQLKHTEIQVLLFNTNDPCQHYSFVCTQLNGSKYFYVSLIIQFKQ